MNMVKESAVILIKLVHDAVARAVIMDTMAERGEHAMIHWPCSGRDHVLHSNGFAMHAGP
jgi:hypothetical protein